MKVSIVVPIYNVVEELLVPCLQALEMQTFRPDDLEIILVDDCSTEGRTIGLADEFAARVPTPRLERHERNLGLNEARRTGVRSARGEYVVFVDGDDILTRDGAEALYLAAVKADADIAIGPLLRWDPERVGYDTLRITSKAYAADWLPRIQAVVSGAHSFTMCARAFRRSILDDDIFDMPEGTLHEDVITTTRLMFAAKRVTTISQPVYFYTANSASITNLFTPRHVDGFTYAIGEWIRLARQHSVFDEVESSIQVGAEKLLNTAVERCVLSGTREPAECVSILHEIDRSYDALEMRRPEPTLPGTRLLVELTDSADAEVLVKEYVSEEHDEYLEQRAPARTMEPKFTVEPSDIALLTKDKIVFICQVDYQLRNAARLARELRKRGHACAVLDNSRFTAGGKRQLDPSESTIFWRTNRIVIEQPPYGVDYLSSAKLVVVFNDFNNDFREALEFRHRLGLPSVCMVEGINDFLRVDFDEPRQLPYRRCDYVFLAGSHDAQYFTDRQTIVAGLPGIEALTNLHVRFPERPLAALNVNFTYGCLEDRRDDFIARARAGVAKAGFDLAITQHPMDGAGLDGLPVTSKTQYELIGECSVFVSRFATGILEALASGKPAIYFNPHGERVEKFTDPMGAFEVATSADELAAALGRVRADIASGVDFRERASAFLQHHAAIGLDGVPVIERFAEAAIEVLAHHAEEQQAAAALLLERQAGSALVSLTDDGVIIGNLEHDHHAQINEEEIIGRYFGPRLGIMIDVGANFGNSLDIYLGKGWIVHAFEPDPGNRKRLFESFPSQRRLVVNDLAVSDKAGEKLPFFSSEESTGISSLAAFTDGHSQVATVTTTTLDDYLAEWRIDHVDFLKIDVEGYDKFVLDGFPWERDRPEVVLAEFEDSKTKPLGYTFDDMANQLIDVGYHVYVSVWHPIVRYGIAHDWRSLERYRPGMDLGDTWGNLIGFRDEPDEQSLYDLVELSVKFSPKWVVAPPTTGAKAKAKAKGSKPSKAAARRRGADTSANRPWYANRADRLRDSNPRLYRSLRGARRAGSSNTPSSDSEQPRSNPLFRVGQVARWSLRAARRHTALTVTLGLVLIAALVVPLFPGMGGWATAGIIVAGGVLVIAALLAAGAVLREAFRRLDRHRERKLPARSKSIRREMSAVERTVSEIAAGSARAQAVQRDVDELKNTVDEQGRLVDATRRDIAPIIASSAGLASTVTQTSDDVVRLRATTAATTEQLGALREQVDTAGRFSNFSNAPELRSHERQLTNEDIARFQSQWASRLGTPLVRRQLTYLAHDICRSEDRCEGRLATTVQAAMLRCLALGSLPGRSAEILEIGTLFGAGAGALYRAALRRQKEPFLTLIDPLEGYYDQGSIDSNTGVPVNRPMLERNLDAMGVPESGYRILQGLSGDREILEQCADRTYDYVLIDGDHSFRGVAMDFTLYSPLVKPGGLLVFDDYGVKDWPEIEQFVDEQVRGLDEWLFIGSDWRTAIFVRQPNHSES